MKRQIFVYGDSNTWGWIPQHEIIPTRRYPAETRWPGILESCIGEEYDIVVDALSGRTTCLDDPDSIIEGVGMNGETYLPAALGSHFPLDLVIIFLGVNDTKERFNRSALDIALGILRLGAIVSKHTGVYTSYPPAEVLLIAPPPLGEIAQVDWFQEIFSDYSVGVSAQVGRVLAPLATAAGFNFLDAGEIMATEGSDGVHFSEENHRILGKAVSKSVLTILGNT